jgi:phage terminase small subunit
MLLKHSPKYTVVGNVTLTPKQQIFAEEYIISGNATQAAIKAGYSKKTAREIGCENLAKPYIKAYISERFEEIEKAKIADANEVIQFYTAVMRGEIKDQFGLDASLADRLKAGDSLMKRYSAVGYQAGTKKVEDDPLTKALKEEAERLNNENT